MCKGTTLCFLVDLFQCNLVEYFREKVQQSMINIRLRSNDDRSIGQRTIRLLYEGRAVRCLASESDRNDANALQVDICGCRLFSWYEGADHF